MNPYVQSSSPSVTGTDPTEMTARRGGDQKEPSLASLNKEFNLMTSRLHGGNGGSSTYTYSPFGDSSRHYYHQVEEGGDGRLSTIPLGKSLLQLSSYGGSSRGNSQRNSNPVSWDGSEGPGHGHGGDHDDDEQQTWEQQKRPVDSDRGFVRFPGGERGTETTDDLQQRERAGTSSSSREGDDDDVLSDVSKTLTGMNL
jgi:hypothetical protein